MSDQGGVSAWGCLPLLDPEADTPSILVNRITDRCKNITFQQLLLRTVKIPFHLYISSELSMFRKAISPKYIGVYRVFVFLQAGESINLVGWRKIDFSRQCTRHISTYSNWSP